MPEQLPAHWGIDGNAGRYGSKAAALFTLPGVMLLVGVLMETVPRSDPRKENLEKFASSQAFLRNVLMIGMFGLHVFSIAYGMGYTFNMAHVALPFIGSVFLVVGNCMPRFRPNSYVGIRNPWTFESEDVWRKTHQLGGRVFVVAGLLMLGSVVLLVLPGSVKAFFLIAVIAPSVIVPSLGAYWYARKAKG